MPPQTEFIFDPFRLDPANDRLLRGGKEVRLTPKAFSVLRYLAEHPDQLITKEVLLKTLWPDIAVTDAVLTVCIGEIRKALGDNPNQPKYIETVHRRGYRFLPSVRKGAQNGNAAAKQDIRFCTTSDDVRIAYSTMGHGPPIVIPPQLVTHLEADLVEGPLADIFEALAQHHTLVRFDMRGTGLSDRNVVLSSEQLFVLDFEAVVDELRLDSFPVCGLCGGGQSALRYYTKHPQRVSHLVFYGTSLEPVSGEAERQSDVTRAVMRASWEIGSKMRVERLMPHGGTREDVERLARWLRLAVSSEVSDRIIELRRRREDLKQILNSVSVPTLVIHRRGDHVPFAGGRELAAKIPGARFIALEGYNHLPATHEEAMELVNPIVTFLAEGQDRSEALRAAVGMPITLLFAAIEGSASLKRRVGENGDKKLLRAHYDAVRRAIESYHGKEVSHTAKGIMASMFSASRAVGCALHIQRVITKRNAVNPDDAVKIRIGLDAVQRAGQYDGFNGASAQLARRICEVAEPGEILVSDAVRQVVSGKGFKFEPAGVNRLKGVDEPVALYRLVSYSMTSAGEQRSSTQPATDRQSDEKLQN